VRHAEVDYRGSAKLDDLLDVSVELEKFGNTSFSLIQHITRDNHLLATVKITLVAVNKNGRATRIPPQLRQIFER
jgi:acyl-CoA thioester hydrolase